MITSQSGEVVAPAGFWQTQEVDKTQFVKLYVNGVKAFRVNRRRRKNVCSPLP